MNNIQKSDYLSEEYRGYKINVYYDCDCVSPREAYDNLGTIYSNHRDYDPDGHRIDELRDDLLNISTKYLDEHYIWLTVSCYEHGGLALWCGGYRGHYDAQWDCSNFGIIAVSKEKVRKEYDWKLLTKKRVEKIESYLESEIKELDAHCKGECYGVEVEDPDGETYNFDAIWGLIGDEAAKEEIKMAKISIDEDIIRRETEEKRAAHLESLINLCWAD